MSDEIVLATRGLRKDFGALRVTDDVELQLAKGARRALIGPNGSGKTTLINLLAGTLAPSAGHIELHGRDVTRASAQRRVRAGLARTFQITTLFPDLSPIEAVTMAVCQRRGVGGALFRPLRAQSDAIDEAYALLESVRLDECCTQRTASLAYGRQRLLEIALALAAKPSVLLLDEPAAGVPQSESAEILDVIARLPGETSVLFIEHDIDLVFRFAERITVLVAGRVLRDGTPSEIARDPEVRRVYLGDDVHAA
ncbi:MAG TPA: ABC transporter ATP-binding protein [Candidatus Elarobacter sp.]|nr:ABC transporter ATP-binding protein [Candidatus Elarobacter sp.]